MDRKEFAPPAYSSTPIQTAPVSTLQPPKYSTKKSASTAAPIVSSNSAAINDPFPKDHSVPPLVTMQPMTTSSMSSTKKSKRLDELVRIHPPGDEPNWIAFDLKPEPWIIEDVRQRIDKEMAVGMDIREYSRVNTFFEQKEFHLTLVYGFDKSKYKDVERRVLEAEVSYDELQWLGRPHFVIPRREDTATGLPVNTAAKGKAYWVQPVTSPRLDELRESLMEEFHPSDRRKVQLHVSIATVEYVHKPFAFLQQSAPALPTRNKRELVFIQHA